MQGNKGTNINEYPGGTEVEVGIGIESGSGSRLGGCEVVRREGCSPYSLGTGIKGRARVGTGSDI